MADSVVAGWLIEIGLQDVIPIFREVAVLAPCSSLLARPTKVIFG